VSKRKVTDYELTACDRSGKEPSYLQRDTFYDRDSKLQGVFAAVREITGVSNTRDRCVKRPQGERANARRASSWPI